MATTLTAVTDTTNMPPRVLLTVAGATGSTTVQVIRVDGDFNQTPVRSADPATLAAGGWVGYDYEAPHGVAVTYFAVPDVDAGAGPAAVTLDPQTPWLIHPGIPDMSVPIRVISARANRVRTASQGVHQPLGRTTPVVVSDGVRRAPTFDLVVGTSSIAQETALDALLAVQSVMLLQITYPNIERSQYDWVAVGDVTESGLVDWFGNTYEQWTLPCTVTDPPVGLLQAQRTWADVQAAYFNWSRVDAYFETWTGVLTNMVGT